MKKWAVYAALSLGCKSIGELQNRCQINIDETRKICSSGIREKEIRYERYAGVEIMCDVIHYYLTTSGRKELRLLCLERRVHEIEAALLELQ